MPKLIFELTVELDDGHTFEVVADQRDMARWEVQPFGWPTSQMQDRMGVLFMRYLAWSAASRQQATTLPWDEFNTRCVEVRDLEAEGGADLVPADADDPGRPAPSGTRSSRSQGSRASR